MGNLSTRLWHLSKNTQTENEQARLFFRAGSQYRSRVRVGICWFGQTYRNDAISYGMPSFAEAAKLIECEARKAVAIDPT